MRALVVGYGRMGAFHAKVLRDLGHDVVTVDPDPNRRADFATIAEARPTWTFERAMTEPRPEPFAVAAVAVPAQHLLDTAYQLAGTPKLLVEKPFATCTRDASMLAAYLHSCNSDVCVGLVERFNPVVRALKPLLRDGTLRDIRHVKFTRWNDRPSFDLDLDLKLHDVDLSAYLRLSCHLEFDTRDRARKRVRRIDVTHADGVYTVDLMAHELSPLHGMWHAFLTDGDYPRPANVIHAHRLLDLYRENAGLEVAA